MIITLLLTCLSSLHNFHVHKRGQLYDARRPSVNVSDAYNITTPVDDEEENFHFFYFSRIHEEILSRDEYRFNWLKLCSVRIILQLVEFFEVLMKFSWTSGYHV